jgi:formyl-CoA transferase
MLAIGREDLAVDPGLAQNDGRTARNEELDAAIGAWVLQHDIDQVVAHLEAAEVPVGKSYTAADICLDAQYRARGMLEQHGLPGGGPSVTIPGIVPRLSETPGRTHWLGPMLGEHTLEVLGRLGLKPEDLAALQQMGTGSSK